MNWRLFLIVFLIIFATTVVSQEKSEKQATNKKEKEKVQKQSEKKVKEELPKDQYSKNEEIIEEMDEETFGVPLPVIAIDPNSGNTLGVLLAVVTERAGRIESIMVPVAKVNDVTGINLDFNYFGFPSEDVTFNFLLSHTSENFWDYKFEYKQEHFLRDNFSFSGLAIFERDAFNRFHGIGADSDEDAESNFASVSLLIEPFLSIEIAEHFSFIFGLGGRYFRTQKSELDNGENEDEIPDLEDVFANEEGVDDDSFALPLTLAFEYDSRDSGVTPSGGVFARVFVELVEDAIFSTFSSQRFGVEGRFYKALDEEEIFILAARGLVEFQEGSDIPFYELSSLGGDETLRGYGAGRFYDKHRVVFNIEQRIRLYRWPVAGVNLDIETMIFVDTGQVFDDVDNIGEDWQIVVGTGIRFVVRGQIVAKVDIGYGEEGSAVFAGLDYPF